MKTFITSFLLLNIFVNSIPTMEKFTIIEQILNEYQNPPKFLLTEMNGRELEDKAYFTVKYDNTFELKLEDGTVFKYIPYKHFGNEPLCNILARDEKLRDTAICIKKLTGNKVQIMLENEDMKSNFIGIKI